ncbi:hypothetical protein CEXT_374581 [Caerostris extrusa]|uniref:Uncharacterized protein n=1 Tax=Caerostris extrusa TaxID=172846 RepID=A0AAV4N214_CAEEX|nr:hypothetical protein CEXT_374581 [Caerostris extrusa]
MRDSDLKHCIAPCPQGQDCAEHLRLHAVPDRFRPTPAHGRSGPGQAADRLRNPPSGESSLPLPSPRDQGKDLPATGWMVKCGEKKRDECEIRSNSMEPQHAGPLGHSLQENSTLQLRLQKNLLC